MSIINILNDDCLYLIVQYLDLIDLLNLEKSSELFHGALKRKFKNIHFKLDCDSVIVKEIALNEIFTRFSNQIRSFSVVATNINASEFDIKITNKVIRICCKNFTKLEKLKIKIAQNFDFGKLAADLSKYEFIQNLIELDLSESDLDDADIIPLIQSCRKLERLNLSRNNLIQGDCLKEITWIKVLDLCNCSKIKLEHLLDFCQESTRLEKLNIVGSGLKHRQQLISLCDLLKQRQPNLKTLFLMDPRFRNQINLAGLNGNEAFQRMADEEMKVFGRNWIYYDIDKVRELFEKFNLNVDQDMQFHCDGWQASARF